MADEDPSRRLLIIAWENGAGLEVDYEPADGWDTWEVLAALKEAMRIVRNDEEREDPDES
jgi:hypothetical protein